MRDIILPTNDGDEDWRQFPKNDSDAPSSARCRSSATFFSPPPPKIPPPCATRTASTLPSRGERFASSLCDDSPDALSPPSRSREATTPQDAPIPSPAETSNDSSSDALFSPPPKALVAAYPTAGVDALAAAAVHRALRALARQGSAVAAISEDLEELFALGGSIAFMARGRLSHPVAPERLNPALIENLMAGRFEALKANHQANAP